MCNYDAFLSNGRCVEFNIKTNETCFTTLYKCTPVDKRDIDDVKSYLIRDFQKEFMKMVPDTSDFIEEFRVFVKTDDYGIIEYLVVNILINTALNPGLADYLDSMFLLDTYILTLWLFFEDKVQFIVQNDIHIIPSNDNDSEIYININGTIDKLDFIYRNRSSEPKCWEPQITQLHRLHVCPYVALNTNEISMHIADSYLYIHEDNSTSKEAIAVPKWEFNLTGMELHLCLDTFMKVFNYTMPSNYQTFNPSPKDTHIDTKQIVSLFCVCFSLVCLLLTIVTYLRFRVLHSQPGINNLLLCMFLLSAQTTYQFGAGQRSLPDIACSVVGAVCHFLWLAVIFSMNICSIHMFKIFKTGMKMCPSFSWRSTFWYVAYIFTTSAVCVSINLSVSFATDYNSGYGGRICYISSNVMQIITFIVPAAIALLSNIALFSYVVFKIMNINIASEKMNLERNYFVIYARLSTLTGVTWIFGFINLLIRHDILEYLFIVLNASQGVFIMIAFVLNKRVCSLCCTEPRNIASVQTDTESEYKSRTMSFDD